jgi:hypothetical protein
MLRSYESLRAYWLGAEDGKIGTVDDLLFDDRAWVIRYLVANTGHWLSDRLVIVSPEALGTPDWEAGVLPVTLTKEQVASSPPIEASKPVSRQREQEVVGYYGWPVYWTATSPGAGPGYVALASATPDAERSDRPASSREDGGSDPHLRSAGEVAGYHIKANDGDIGHLEDFIVDDDIWSIPFVVVDTRNWLPGKRVLLAPDWILGVSWDTKAVRFDLPKELIKTAPAYDPSEPVNEEDATRLYDYYGRPRGWRE